ncbi:nitrate regulatory gene2 protein-like [Rosa chinensis]|uniref:nitrate regulatory gene2 protein-like n=1 Tax=Rosa chinensis TaxID=74649 RepID=UPI000D08D799|nr:nitrate regulatory gene2 protein-like [Rosa chinensis]
MRVKGGGRKKSWEAMPVDDGGLLFQDTNPNDAAFGVPEHQVTELEAPIEAEKNQNQEEAQAVEDGDGEGEEAEAEAEDENKERSTKLEIEAICQKRDIGADDNTYLETETETSEYNYFHNIPKSQPAAHINRSYSQSEKYTQSETERSEYDFFIPNRNPKAPTKAQLEKYAQSDREEVQCSEWGDNDHYSTTSLSENEDDDRDLRSEMGTWSNFDPSVRAESVAGLVPLA